MTELDPITFEVVKHRLWQINDEQGIAIKTISASPIVVEGNDFNVGLFTADGQVVTAGIGSVVHVTTMGDTLRSIIEKAGRIRDGDVFMTNDPFLGALHQNDVVVASPLFRDGEIFMWVGNVVHHPDVGGVDEGSFCINARTIYQDPPRYFLKIVNEGELSTEVEHTFVTNSRLPDMVALDLRAQIGAIHVAKTRLDALLDEQGKDVIETVMRRSIDLAERQVRDCIAQLPEGSWTGEAWMDGDRVGSDRIHRVALTLTREGDNLHFDYTGSSPQVDAAVNATWQATVSGSAVPLFSFLCQGDIDWNEGLRRCLRVTAPEGTVVNAQFPAPVSISTVGFRWLVTVAATQAVAKMFNASETFRDRVCPSWNSSANCNNVFATKDGKRVGALLSDHRGSGAAARSFADGFSHAGTITSFAGSLGNIEGAEWKLPLLYVYRRRLPDSGGAGMYRGGLTSAVAITPYGVDQALFKSTNTAGTDQTNAHGIDGGYPGAGSQVTLIRSSHVWDRLRSGRTPMDDSDFGGDLEHLPSKAEGVLDRDDVMVFYPAGGGGYGDPMDRVAEDVGRDVADGLVSPDRARDNYGVISDDDGNVDHEATTALRDDIRARRKQGREAPWGSADKPAATTDGASRQIGENVTLDGDGIISCRCGHKLSGGAISTSAPLSKAGPWIAMRWNGDSPNFELEETACPGCGVMHAVREVRNTKDR
ncbi:MAG: hydantoinase B/oxoprolinase family protein [Rhodospirillales bacterium]|nr:hydantoinase B/oxoprolinase family protein [Rhodospirillales bacterium]